MHTNSVFGADRDLASSPELPPMPPRSTIVRLRSAPPVASYRGGIPGFPATAVWDSDPNGNAIDATADNAANGGDAANGADAAASSNSPTASWDSGPTNSKATGATTDDDAHHPALLQRMQQAVLRDSRVDAGKMVYSYVHVSNGFAAILTAAQVQRMRRHPSVASVTPSRTITRRATSTTTDAYKSLKLHHALSSAASAAATPAAATPAAATPAAATPAAATPAAATPAAATPAAATPAAATPAAATPAGASSDGDGTVIGIVDSGVWPEHPSFDDTAPSPVPCARPPSPACPMRPLMPPLPCPMRPHPTLRAAAGNSGVEVPGGGTISGVAPKARLAIYKVYWRAFDYSESTETTHADVFAAVDRAVADGVDVLTVSLHSTVDKHKHNYFEDAPFLGALAVGVRACGGYGVHAEGMGCMRRVWGACGGYGVHAEVGDLGTTKYNWWFIDRHIAIHYRAPYYISVGASSVSQASLTSMLTATTTIGAAVGAAAESPENTTGATVPWPSATAYPAMSTRLPATITPSATNLSTPTFLPMVPGWSSSGPVAPTDCTICKRRYFDPTNAILKPDIIAPGVSILAAAPGKTVGEAGSLQVSTESAISAAHVAGIAALIIQQHPDWSPAQVMSAMMTTAGSTDYSNRMIRNMYGLPATPWEMGAGHVFPARALDPGLTYDAGEQDFRNLLAGLSMKLAQKTLGQVPLKPVPARNLNRPSISLGNIVNKLVARRTVTSVSDTTSTYRVRIKAPKAVRVAPGQRVSFKVKVVVRRKLKKFKYGSITWEDDKGHSVRSVLVFHCKPSCVYLC
ncbi:unnamed protein product [Closterium sp. Yama58-4]|nr:unnamed protein product [Closterium sp. Yama58-4]